MDIVTSLLQNRDACGKRLASDEFRALSQKDRHTVRALSAVLRVADAFDRTHYGVVRDMAVSRRGSKLTLQLSAAGDAALEIWEARQRVGLLEELLGLDAEFRVGP